MGLFDKLTVGDHAAVAAGESLEPESASAQDSERAETIAALQEELEQARSREEELHKEVSALKQKAYDAEFASLSRRLYSLVEAGALLPATAETLAEPLLEALFESGLRLKRRGATEAEDATEILLGLLKRAAAARVDLRELTAPSASSPSSTSPDLSAISEAEIAEEMKSKGGSPAEAFSRIQARRAR